ncbi:ABC transporter permease [Micromonospora sp. NPDC048830]|uniref:ABC transporter permease n=1 Tax=Micromonospora sp. NPDC048830 TaxID=3364257 RepID=UPI003711EB8E
MLAYVIRRVGQTIPVLALVAIGIFLVVHILPGDPVEALVGQDATQADIDAMRDQYGLNDPLWSQFVSWLGAFVQGDLGTSYATGKHVSSMIGGALPVTITLALAALIVSLVVGIPAALTSGLRKGSLADKAILGGSLVGISMPTFVLGVLLILVFAVWLGWLPASGYVDLAQDPFQGLRAITLPALSLGLMYAANITRIGRAATLEVVPMDYVTMARASGVGFWSLRVKHILRNALIPILTVVGVTFGSLLGGAVVTEKVFNLSGIGSLLINAITRRDYPVIQATVFLISVIYLLINLLVDILYAFVDPKVRYGNR